MTRQLWTRFIATSLILFGNNAFTSEINQSDNSEVATFLSAVHAYQTEYLDDSTDEWPTSHIDITPAHPLHNHQYLTHFFTTHSITPSPKYNHNTPRAPPAFSL